MINLISCLIVALLFSAAVYLILHKSFLRVLIGFGLLTHAANLMILTLSKSPINKASPVILQGKALQDYVDPLPQALILTAIVIGFGASAYLIVMMYRLYKDQQTTLIKDVFQSHE